MTSPAPRARVEHGRQAFRWAFAFLAAAIVLLLWPLRLLVGKIRERPRSLWTGTPILTLPIKARAERMIGFDAISLVLADSYITRSFDINLAPLARQRLVGRLVPYATFIWACLTASRIHSFCDRGLLPGIERLKYNPVEPIVYRALGIDLFLWTYGADVRSSEATRALGPVNCCVDCDQVGKACICEETVRRRYLAQMRSRCTAMFAMGDMIEYTEGSRNDLHFWPVDLAAEGGRRYAPRYPDAVSTRPLRVVHAPNHRNFKGTRHLEEAVARLRSAGAAIDLVMVERLPNDQALEVYRSADLVFDQCLIGFHGYFALEAMALGKPVMCYIRKESYLLAPTECPIVRIDTLSIGATLRSLLADRARLLELGVRGRAYVERHFSLEAFAARLGAAIPRK